MLTISSLICSYCKVCQIKKTYWKREWEEHYCKYKFYHSYNHPMTLSQKRQAARNSKSVRLIVLFLLLAVILYMYFFVGKMKWLLLVLMVIVGGAIGLQVADYDLDIETLWKTGSFSESRVELKKWVKIIWSDCVGDTVNCSNFTTQTLAQQKYSYCASQIKLHNKSITDDEQLKNLDVYGLDGDKDGIVCEHLPK